MRVAKTVEDVAELFGDYQILLQLTDGPELYVQFPVTEEEEKHREHEIECQKYRDAMYPTNGTPDTNPRWMRNATIKTVRSLVGSPRFCRLTTTADQLARFALANNKNPDTEYGQIKVSKKAGMPLTMIFENTTFARRFFADIEHAK